ncbi:putative Phosphatidylinositol 3-and 4-kinase [Taphrina deformans PYCC 5710]|uniref:Phosphatidylinositol 3-and 4-kinase n=1 Tax=Taphrina deformans (strain PYCC 5710 / ATCC 11124 / CBS 356.35 / IMI 108563 / JCM 9778 / NBRC 8474) TaxID=1097556 RepID=R4X840_TAPDE|nr:putative Phosphatidylinositol 3-and 4-kinase [Taphrina deformans PYCC 5710]|eukprot:CCG81638.1 putative Phosphatidylinositol 3-and 4-kinase [Taphrina deformans PYCC 5710]
MWQVWDKIPKPIADVYTHDIINFLVETVLHEYQLERSESTFLFVVEFLSAIARAWALAPIDDNIVIMARKVFDWLVRIVLTAQLASAMVRQKVVKLCSKLLRYGVDTSSREDPEMTTISLRTILVNELEDYDLRVALTAASVITAIFHTHDTSTYDQIYNDVTEALATVSDQYFKNYFTAADLHTVRDDARVKSALVD